MERAIMWAMNLHPDERPQSITQLRDYFTGKSVVIDPENREGKETIRQFFSRPQGRAIIIAAVGLMLLGLIGSIIQ